MEKELPVNLREFCRQRVLQGILNNSREAALKAKKPSKMFILVLEEYTLNIVNALVKMSDLTSNGVFAVEKLELRRKPFPQAHAIYFLRPEASNFKRMEEDAAAGCYSHIHAYFTTEIPDSAMEVLRAQRALIAKLLTLKELNIDF